MSSYVENSEQNLTKAEIAYEWIQQHSDLPERKNVNAHSSSCFACGYKDGTSWSSSKLKIVNLCSDRSIEIKRNLVLLCLECCDDFPHYKKYIKALKWIMNRDCWQDAKDQEPAYELSQRLGEWAGAIESMRGVYSEMPNKLVIAEYWLRQDGRYIYSKLISMNDPQCFACLKPSGKSWLSSRLDKAHIISCEQGGPSIAENLMLLCSSCHRDAPMTTSSMYFLDWVNDRAMWIESYLEKVESVCCKYIATVNFDEYSVKEWRKNIKGGLDFMGFGLHACYLLPATFVKGVGAALWKQSKNVG